MKSEMSGTFTPPREDSRLDHLGTYRRSMPVNLERMFENALDWEHLPFLHASSFSGIDCEAAGDWGWRARVGMPGDGAPSLLELSLDRDHRRWITRTLDGEGAGTEIWTHALVESPERLTVVVDFFRPGIEPQARARLGAAYARGYDVLYDEDERMMVERQAALDAGRRPDSREILAVPLDESETLLHANGRRWRVTQLDGASVAFESVCPHWLGPLDDADILDGVVTCPWHGYQFSLRTGECLSGHGCRMRPARRVVRREEGILLLDPEPDR